MVKVPAETVNLLGRTLSLPPYWMDKFDMTNAQFKAFVDSGGYRRREL